MSSPTSPSCAKGTTLLSPGCKPWVLKMTARSISQSPERAILDASSPSPPSACGVEGRPFRTLARDVDAAALVGSQGSCPGLRSASPLAFNPAQHKGCSFVQYPATQFSELLPKRFSTTSDFQKSLPMTFPQPLISRGASQRVPRSFRFPEWPSKRFSGHCLFSQCLPKGFPATVHFRSAFQRVFRPLSIFAVAVQRVFRPQSIFAVASKGFSGHCRFSQWLPKGFPAIVDFRSDRPKGFRPA